MRSFLCQPLVRVKALQERYLAKEEVVTRVRKHNATLMNEQGQYKETMRTFNKEVKELREKLVEAGSQKQKLQDEVMALREKAEMAGTDAVQKFKTSQSFIDICADYYGTGFDDCLKQVASTFLQLDLSKISMDAPEPLTLARDVTTDDDDGVLESQPLPKVDGGVVLAQLAITPLALVSKTPELTVDADGALLQKSGGTPADVLVV